jgi:glycerate 2-kinase
VSRQHALEIFRAALRAADPEKAVLEHLQLHRRALRAGGHIFPLAQFDRIQVIGAGKAGAGMARAIEELLGSRLAGGWVNIPDGAALPLKRVHLHQAGHPVPDQRGVAGAREIARIAREAGPRDLLICLISGGASALMPLPAPGVTLAAKKAVTRKLLASGATIHEINTVRKHLSAIKGGHLAALARPATLITLILSDVIGDDLSVIGSGPTVHDPTTCADAARILARYKIAAPPLTETPKRRSPALNVIVGSNRQSIDAAARKARELGYRSIVLSTTIDGETRDIARMHVAIARELIARRASGRGDAGRGFRSSPRPERVCFLSGGETTVTLRGKGLGGRNQEFVLAALLAMNGTPGITVFSAGTDGRDGPTSAAGAIADRATLRRARALGLDPQVFLDANDSYHFFDRTGGLITTGPTGTNVMDVRVVLV